MTDEQVIAIVNRSLAEEFELDPSMLKPDARLVEELGFDSLDHVDLVVVLQKAFGVSLREEPRVRQVRTLGDVHRLVIAMRGEMETRVDRSTGQAGGR